MRYVDDDGAGVWESEAARRTVGRDGYPPLGIDDDAAFFSYRVRVND
jgi:hypothetical protein